MEAGFLGLPHLPAPCPSPTPQLHPKKFYFFKAPWRKGTDVRQGDQPLELHPCLGQRPDSPLDLTLGMVSPLPGPPDRGTLETFTLIHTSAHFPTLMHTPRNHCSSAHVFTWLAHCWASTRVYPQRNAHIHAFTCLLSLSLEVLKLSLCL